MLATIKISRLCVRLQLTVTVFLLYQSFGQVYTKPVVVSGGAAPQSSSVLQNHDFKLLAMPIWARKAGGNWKPELAREALGGGNGNPEISLKEIGDILEAADVDEEEQAMEKRNFEESGAISEAAANHQLHEEQLQSEQERETVKSSAEKDESQQEKEDDDEYEYEYDELQPEEQECPEDQFWHIRGLKCVPYDCPGGNTWRDSKTGDCILKYYGYRNRWRSRPWRP